MRTNLTVCTSKPRSTVFLSFLDHIFVSGDDCDCTFHFVFSICVAEDNFKKRALSWRLFTSHILCEFFHISKLRKRSNALFLATLINVISKLSILSVNLTGSDSFVVVSI